MIKINKQGDEKQITRRGVGTTPCRIDRKRLTEKEK